jgi:signal transduction histidine kinase
MAKRKLKELAKIPEDLKNLPLELAKLSSSDLSWKSNLDILAALLRKTIIFDNFVLYKKIESPDNYEVIFAKALGRGKASGETISWGESIVSQVFSTHNITIQEFNPIEFPDRLDHPFVIGFPIEITPDIVYTLMIIRFGGPSFTNEVQALIELFAQHIKVILQKKNLLDKITSLEAEHEHIAIQDDFISTISHELLSPIGFIKGYTTTLMRSDTTWNVDTQKEFLQVIDEETDRLQELLDNMLDSARLQNGSMPIEKQPVRIDVLLRDAVQRVIAHQSNIGIKTEFHDHLPGINGDSRRLTQVFENLISNAIKYAPGANLTISADILSNQIHILFNDDGPGISPRYLPFLFQKFYRSPDGNSNIRGSGLGLYICRQIIEAHSGEIFAESTLGKGTQIHILLPITNGKPDDNDR